MVDAPCIAHQRARLVVGLVVLLVTLLTLPHPASSQATSIPSHTSNEEVTIGIALSGGGAKGFAHIGVLKALETAGVSVDVVAGTSMGAVIGGLYATGYSARQLEKIARDRDWGEAFSDTPPRRQRLLEQRRYDERLLVQLPFSRDGVYLPTGLIRGQRITALLTSLLVPAHPVDNFTQLPRSFVAVATDLETGDAVPLTNGYLPQAIRASIAIPSVFTPVERNGQMLVDGGVARNLPAEDARDLGADIVICSDVGGNLQPAEDLRTLADVMRQVVGFRMVESTRAQLDRCDLVFEPDISGYDLFSFEAVDSLITRGRRAVENQRAAVDSMLQRAGGAKPPRGDLVADADTVRVATIAFENIDPFLEQRVRDILRLRVPGTYTISEIERATTRVFGADLFERVLYRLQPRPDGYVDLVFSTVGRTEGNLNVGLRYDSAYGAAIGANFTLPTRLGGGTGWGGGIRLGTGQRLSGHYALPALIVPKLNIQARLLRVGFTAERAPIDLFEDGERVGTVRTERMHAQLRASAVLANKVGLAFSLQPEWYEQVAEVGASDAATRSHLVQARASMYIDTLNDPIFPHRGLRIAAYLETADAAFLGNETLTQATANATGALPLTPTLTLQGHATLGHTLRGIPPLHYRYRTGGAFAYGLWEERQFPLLGYQVQEQSGLHLQRLGAALQLQVWDDGYVAAQWNAARTPDTWTVIANPAAFDHGAGLVLGTDTFIGPMRIALMTSELAGPYIARVSLGPSF